MNDITPQLKRARVLPLLPRLVPEGGQLYLVGGSVRDHLLGKPTRDYDFATSFDPTELARDFARQIAGTWFWLDQARRQSRVVRKLPSGTIHYDFAPFRAETLEGDLAARDFTLNSIALSLSSPEAAGELIDPLRGAADLQRRHLIVSGPDVLQDDPLRVLRGIRYALSLGCVIPPETHTLMKEAASKVPRMPVERIGAELLLAWNTGKFEEFTALIRQLGLQELVFGRVLAEKALNRGVEATAFAREWMERLTRLRQGKLVKDLLEVAWQPECTTRSLLLLTVFFAASDVKRPQDVLRRGWCLGKGPAKLAGELIQLSPQQWGRLKKVARTPRARALWTESLGPAPEAKILWHLLMNPQDGPGHRLALEALQEWPQMQRNGRVPDLVNGQWLTRVAGIPPGPEMGRLLQELKAAEMAGAIRTPEEARATILAKKR